MNIVKVKIKNKATAERILYLSLRVLINRETNLVVSTGAKSPKVVKRNGEVCFKGIPRLKPFVLSLGMTSGSFDI